MFFFVNRFIFFLLNTLQNVFVFLSLCFPLKVFSLALSVFHLLSQNLAFMTQRRQISVHLGMALLIPLKSDSSLMVLSTFIQRLKTFLSYGKICSTSMLSFLAKRLES